VLNSLFSRRRCEQIHRTVDSLLYGRATLFAPFNFLAFQLIVSLSTFRHVDLLLSVRILALISYLRS
jgi:hypothetical protein